MRARTPGIAVRVPPIRRYDAARPLTLAALALLAAAGYVALWPLLPEAQRGVNTPTALLMTALVLPYAATCWLLLRVPAPTARIWRRMEWGVLLGGTLLFRALVFPLPPVLSRDAYRYVWDALLTSHGLSPYLHGPNWPGYNAIRPPAFYPHVPFKPVPTIYPPGAQAFYRLAFSVAPLNVWAIKAEMASFDLLAGLLLALLLRRLGQDTRRAFIYLWAPLPVIEFAFSGHVDAAAIACILLVLLLDQRDFRGSRALIGVVLGFATLIKFYPLVLLVALLRRRDWALLGTLAATLLLGYEPYAHDGLASFGFLSTYLTELDTSYGGAVLLIRAIGFGVGLTPAVVRGLGVLGAAVAVGAVLWLRVRPNPPTPFPTREGGEDGTPLRAGAAASGSPLLPGEGLGVRSSGSWWARRTRGVRHRLLVLDARVPAWVRLTRVQAAFALIAIWLVFSPHVFPWYTAALLPFAALALALPPRRPAHALAVGAWVFCGLIPLAYVAYELPAWYWLYPATYLLGLAAAVATWLAPRRPPRAAFPPPTPVARPLAPPAPLAPLSLRGKGAGGLGPRQISQSGKSERFSHMTSTLPIKPSTPSAGQLPLPRELYLESTNRCNEKCDQCPRTHLGREPDRDLSLAEVRAITDQLPELERVVLHGLGEPLMNPELPAIVVHLRARGAHVLFNTNALLLNERRARALIAADLNELRVSLDGATPGTYARVRGVNAKALPLIVNNLTRFTALHREMGAERPVASLWFTAMRENIEELPQVVEIAATTGVPEVYVQRFIYFGKGLAQAEQALFARAHERELEIIRTASARCQELGIRFRATGAATPAEYLERGEHQPAARPWAGCQRPYTLAYITAHGNVFSCCFAPFHPGRASERQLGNVFEQPFAAIWNGERYTAFRAAFASDSPWDQCAGCGSKWSL